MTIKYLDSKRISWTTPDSDTLGSAVDGTNSSTATNVSTPINGQTSVEFGNNEYANSMGTTSSFSTLVGSSWSVSFWLHYAGVGNNGWGAGSAGSGNLGTLLTTGQISNTGNGFVIGLDDNNQEKFYLLIASGQGTSGRSFDDVFTDAIALASDKWHHYVFNFDNTSDELKIYRDGSLVQTIAYGNTVPTPSATTTSAFTMGRQGEMDQRYFIGEMADVGIFNRNLTTTEISYLFNSFDPDSATSSSNTGKSISTMSSSSGLLTNYKLDDVNYTNSAVAPTKPTNVEDNSILVEKDTGKRYWFDTEGATESTGTYAHAFPVGSYDNDKQGFYVANTSSAVYGKTINSVSFWLKRGTSTSGTAYIRVWSDSGSGNTGTQAHEFGSILLSDLTESYVKHTFSTGSHTLAVNDTVGVQYSGGSSTTSPVVEGASSDVYDGVNTIRNRFTTGGTFSPVTTHDIKFEVTSPTWTYEYALPTISGLKLHLDASDSTTITKDGSNLVSAWNDKSGEGNHISQATASKQPLWVANTQNGLPLIRFDGTDDQLNRSTFVSGAISQGFYMFVVMKPTVGAASNPYNFDGGASARGWCYTNSSDEVRYGSATEQIIDSNLPSTPVMYTFFVNGSSSNVRKNSVSTTSGTLGSTSSNGLWLACRHNDTSFGSPDHAEFLFYDNDIGTTNRDAVEAYLKKKWGL